MTEAQKRKMAEGRARAAKTRRRNAIDRVRYFKAWVAREAKAYAEYRLTGERGGWADELRSMPIVPTDGDYKMAGVAA